MFRGSRHATKSSVILRVDDITDLFQEFNSTSLHVDEAYVVRATPGGRDSPTAGLVEVVGQTAAGVFYGVQTVLGLLKGRRLVAGDVVDAPRFAYRGLMVDVARNFVAKDAVLRTIDALASYKMNRLHLHLTDDQGWRLHVPDLPELTAVGSRRGHHHHAGEAEEYRFGRRSMLLPYLGSGPSPDDDDATSNGFYSGEDYRDILRHARRRHVIVIPEVDVPGHSGAAILSMHPVRGKRNVTLVDPNDRLEYVSVNNHKNNVMNPCLRSSMSFVEHVIRTLVELHKVGHWTSAFRQLLTEYYYQPTYA